MASASQSRPERATSVTPVSRMPADRVTLLGNFRLHAVRRASRAAQARPPWGVRPSSTLCGTAYVRRREEPVHEGTRPRQRSTNAMMTGSSGPSGSHPLGSSAFRSAWPAGSVDSSSRWSLTSLFQSAIAPATSDRDASSRGCVQPSGSDARSSRTNRSRRTCETVLLRIASSTSIDLSWAAATSSGPSSSARSSSETPTRALAYCVTPSNPR